MNFIAGIDEVGRGCLFGPVVAACVVMKSDKLPYLVAMGVKDSKKLSPSKRVKLVSAIKQVAEGVGIGYARVAEIEEYNILQASLLAMSRAVAKLPRQPDICLVDGRHIIPNLNLPQKAIAKGDESVPIIGAASIIAKVWRDELITRWSERYPEYDLANNKGYGTKKHLLALQEYGISPQHRASFIHCVNNRLQCEKHI